MKEYKNVVFRRPKDEGIVPVWDEKCKILMLGSITAIDGMNKGFYYASYKNQLWELLDYSMNTDIFMKLKNELKDNYESYKNNEITITPMVSPCKQKEKVWIYKQGISQLLTDF